MPPEGNEATTPSALAGGQTKAGQQVQQGQGQKKTKATKTPKPKKEPKPKAEKPKKEPKPPRVKKEKPVRATPAHMSKIDKVAATLPQLSSDATVLFTAANNMSTADMNALIAHLTISVRKRGIQDVAQGKTADVAIGAKVKIVSAQNPKFINMTGVVSKVQRIRCYVKIDGKTYPTGKDGDYFFKSDCAVVGGQGQKTNIAETITRLTTPASPLDLNTIEDDEEEHGSKSKTG